MSQPTPYTPNADFSQQEANNASGRSTVNTAALDAEFAAIESTLDQTLANLQLIQRDDGQLKDTIVSVMALDQSVINLMGGWTLKGAWLTVTDYAINDIVSSGEYTYVCLTAHHSGIEFDSQYWSRFGFAGSADAAIAASQASASAASAATSATTATTKATSATASATSAATSSGNAASYASTATTKAGEAAASATNAANSAAKLPNLTAAGANKVIISNDLASAWEYKTYQDLVDEVDISARGAEQIGFLPAGTGAVATDAQSKLRESVSAKDFGAVGDGVADDTAAIQAAITASSEGAVIILNGTHKITSSIVVNKSIHICGGGARQGVQVHAVGAIVAFNVTAAGAKISGFRLYGDRAVGSKGILIDNAPKVIVEGMDVELLDIGIHQTNGGFHVSLDNLRLRNMLSKVVWLEDGVGTRLKDVMYDTDVGTYAEPTFGGIHLQQEGTQLELCDFIRANRGLVIECAASRSIEWIMANNCFFDTCGYTSSGRGIHIINDQATKHIRGLWFNQVWTATCKINVLVEGTGVIDGVHFSGCPNHNAYSEGVRASGALLKNLEFSDCDFFGNSSGGVGLANNVYLNVPSRVAIRNCKLGNGLNWSSSPSSLIFLDTLQQDSVIAGNTFDSSAASKIVDNSAGTVYFTEQNYGFLTENSGGVSFTSTDTLKTVSHGLAIQPSINDIQITPTTGWGSSTVFWITNVGATTFDVRVNPAPGSPMNFAWQAKVINR